MPEPDPLPSIKTPWGSATPPTGASAGDIPPIPIPDHTLIRRIGKGSYGEVWLARNALGVYRAVKIIDRLAFDDDRPFEREFAGMQRFEPVSRSHESQLNILQVGRGPHCFYYVMELADDMGDVLPASHASLPTGESKLQSGPAGKPALQPDTYTPRNLRSELLLRGRLPVDECIRLGLALTTALEHLHRHGLVHRDIKPSNIVFVNGIPKLADIGLVALAESTMSFVGTEGYLPPEGPGTVQADLFSLGKVLYEISTGRDRQQFPELPTGINELPDRAALAEFNEVLLRACAPGVKQRYESAAEMHADLALLQSGKSVARMRAVERRLRFVQRAAAVVTVIAALAAGLYLWQARQTKQVRELANQNRQIAEEYRQVAQLLKDMLQGVGPSVALGRDTTMLREILDKAAARIGQDLKHQPEVEAQLRTTLGRVYRDLGDYEKSEAMLREALAIRQRLFVEHPSVADSLVHLADTLQDYFWRFETEAMFRVPSATLQAKLAEAEALSRQALLMRRKLHGTEHEDVADALGVLSSTLYRQRKLPEAEHYGREALALARKLLPNDHPTVLTLLNNLATVLGDVDKLQEAEALFREGLPIARQRLGETHPELVDWLFSLGQVVKRQGRLAEAESLYDEAIATERKLGRAEPSNLAALLNELAILLLRQGKSEAAETSLREALRFKIRLYGAEHIEVAAVLGNLGDALADQGKLEEAESLQEQALAMRRKLLGENHPHLAISLRGLATLRQRQGRLAEAESCLRQALAIEQKLAGDGRPYAPELPASSRMVLVLYDLAGLFHRQGRTAETETALREALDYLRKPTAVGPSPQTPTLGLILHHLAEALAGRKDFSEARAPAEEAVGLYRLHPEWPANERQHASAVLKNLLMELGDFEAAESLCRERLQHLRAAAPPNSPELNGALAELAFVMLARHKFGDAEPLARECLEGRERNSPDDWQTFNTRSLLGAILLGQKKYEAAEPLLTTGYEGMHERKDKISSQGESRLKEGLQRLVQLYEETDRPEQAALWKQKLAEYDQAENK
jgi:tetratricopeptide (TPR) repeat protein